VERTLAGDRDAYRVLVERHSYNVFGWPTRMTGNRHDAEEVVQAAFLRGYQSWGSSGAIEFRDVGLSDRSQLCD